jgi:hypothetical protein
MQSAAAAASSNVTQAQAQAAASPNAPASPDHGTPAKIKKALHQL